MNKNLRNIIAIFTLVALTVSSFAAISPMMGEVRAASPKPFSEINRLSVAKNVALKHVKKRDDTLANLQKSINKHSKRMRKADLDQAEKMIAEMKNETRSWRNMVNRATDLEKLKKDHVEMIGKTRFYRVFVPKIKQTVASSVLRKRTANATSLTKNLEKRLARKANLTSDNKYEQVENKIGRVKRDTTTAQRELVALQNLIYAYSPSSYNADKDKFMQERKANLAQLSSIRKQVVSIYKLNAQIKRDIARLPNK